MKRIDEYNDTLNSAVYAKLRKDLLADVVLDDDTYMSCSRCKPHKGCNANHKPRNGKKPRKDWEVKNVDRRI